MYEYKQIVKTAEDLTDFSIENNMLKALDVCVLGHFGNVCTAEMLFTNCALFATYNVGPNLSRLLAMIIEILGLTNDEVPLQTIKDVPIRLVIDGNKAVGFGHFMKDEFLLVDDIVSFLNKSLEPEADTEEEDVK